MPYSFEFDATNRIFRCRFKGRVTFNEFAEYLRMVGKYVGLTKARGGIVDLSEATGFDASPEAIRRLAIIPAPALLMDIPRIILVPSDEIYRAMRAFEIEAHGTRPAVHVVRTRKEARAILGVQKLHFVPTDTKGEPS